MFKASLSGPGNTVGNGVGNSSSYEDKKAEGDRLAKVLSVAMARSVESLDTARALQASGFNGPADVGFTSPQAGTARAPVLAASG